MRKLFCLIKHKWIDDNSNKYCIYPRRICLRCNKKQQYFGPMYGWNEY